MLDEVSPEQFDEWQAYWQIEPFGDEWLQTGTVASSAHNAGVLAAMAQGAEVAADAFKKAEDFFPIVGPPAEPKYLSDREMEHCIKLMFSGKK